MARRGLSVLLAALLLAAACDGESEEQPSVAEGDRAPDFTLPSAAGGSASLSDFAGEKPALLYFSMGPG